MGVDVDVSVVPSSNPTIWLSGVVVQVSRLDLDGEIRRLPRLLVTWLRLIASA